MIGVSWSFLLLSLHLQLKSQCLVFNHTPNSPFPDVSLFSSLLPPNLYYCYIKNHYPYLCACVRDGWGGSKLIKMSPFYRMGWLVWGEPYFSLSINPLLDPLLIYNGKKKIPMLTPEWIGRGLPLVEPPVKCGQASVIYEKSLAQTC